MKMPKTQAEALAVLKARGMLRKLSYLYVKAALRDWNKYRG